MANDTAYDAAQDTSLTPVMRQYFAAKQAHPDCLMFCRIGDFYELFYDDAILVARELQLTLTARDKEKKQPMCGVPYHAAEVYLQRLLRKGYRIALCEQMEDPKTVKGIVKREVTRVLTPGTAIDPSLGAGDSNWLAAVVVLKSGTAGLAMVDLSTGDLRATEFPGPNAFAQAADELGRIRPAELLYTASGLGLSAQPTLAGESEKTEDSGLDAIRTKTAVDEYVLTAEYALPLVRQHFKVHSLDGLGLAAHEAAAVAVGGLLHYLRSTKQGALEHVTQLRFYERSGSLELDAVSVRNLELVDPLFSGESVQTTLCYTLDACCTPMGKRLLRATLLRPSLELTEIEPRLEAVAEAHADLLRRESVRRAMDNILDLERLLGRVAADSAGPRETMALAATLACLPELRRAVLALKAPRWQALAAELDPLEDLHELITATVVAEPPATLADGNVIRPGLHAELDELRELSHSGRQALIAIEERERQRTGIGSLKVRYNTVFGYYIEITKANARAVPADYERKQTLVNAERFTTPELKDYENRILTAQDRSLEIERRIFAELRAQLLAAASRIRDSARRIAEIDLLSNFAHLSALRGWTRPQVDDSTALEFVQARHPVVERRMEDSGIGRFIPNSLYLDAQNGPSILLMTGPNMGGKSTYLRMAALLVIMAQCGCFVPAERMRLGLVDRIYTRIGASDNVARGRSTFMVEMTETAAILNTATSRSLVLLDEMGRGTATYDGLSLAWATVEHLHNGIGARSLFATHYHELTLLSEKLPRLQNVRVSVKESASGIVFLHTVEPGAASKSYGIEVARLAGLPQSVITRAREVLKVHERAEKNSVSASLLEEPAPSLQMTMFTPLSQRVVDRLAEADINSLTPLEALNLLADLRRELKDGPK
ncbi:DNA mismatch repair protein MutS [Granulicella sp. WH15]|uniref:DNA mismatch repair protein MutS n=1 Tax=Granulicella sp. WH15 TaxID=2602070 RepID=UPI0013668F4F|nr:DNA mismatch repair protein MutS [Granulicella sp. WH15]QHN03565.1 DNA mismatch repair protein MutS [Granulicella sp. WH15]